MFDFDYGIIGGGPAGYTLAMSLAKSGKKVVLFEKKFLGGTCLNYGCIPTKSLLHASEYYANLFKAKEFGVDIEMKALDFSAILAKRDKIVEKIRKSLELAVKNSGVTVVYAEAKVLDEKTISADKIYNVEDVIYTTGAKPREIEGLEFDGKFILNSDDVLKLDELPKSVLIVGSGAIGIEWARIFNNFGVDVHVVEMASNLIPVADVEVSKRIERIFKQKNIKFYLNDRILEVSNNIVTLESGKTVEPDFVFVAVGRVPISLENGTCESIGDARGEVQLAHYAIQQAYKLVQKESLNIEKSFVPSVIYGEPEIAWVGLREQDCGDNYQKVLLPISALGKSWCDDSTEGFIKLLVNDDKILGAHIVSKEASALIHQVLIAMQNNLSVEQLKKVCFAHPTYSEGIFEALCRL